MPELLSKVAPNAGFLLSPDVLVDRPEFANPISQIFGLWAIIEQEIKTLFVRITGAEETSAVAVFSILVGDGLKRTALDAAAKARFGSDSDDFEIYSAVLNLAKQTAKTRHELAHRLWGTSPDLPDSLLLADSKTTEAVTVARNRLRTLKPLEGLNNPEKENEILNNLTWDRERIFVYKAEDFRSAAADMRQAMMALQEYDLYIQPQISEEDAKREISIMGPRFTEAIEMGTAAGALRRLSSLTLFQEARAQIRSGKSKKRRPLPG